MQIRAIKTFNGKMGLIRTGAIVTVDDKYGKQLVNSKLAEVHVPKDMGPEEQPGLEPDSNTNLGDAPRKKDQPGNESGDDEQGPSSQEDDKDEETGSQRDQASGSTDSSSVERPAAGKTPSSSSRRAGPRSRKRT